MMRPIEDDITGMQMGDLLKTEKLTIEGACVTRDVSFILLVSNDGKSYRAKGANLVDAFRNAYTTYHKLCPLYTVSIETGGEPIRVEDLTLEGALSDDKLTVTERQSIRALGVGDTLTHEHREWTIQRTR